MALSDAALVIGANAIDAEITHAQLHSADPGASGTNAPLATRVAVNGSVEGDGDISWTNIAFTGLGANQAVSWLSFWSSAGSGGPPATGGTFYSRIQLTGDATANSAGEYTVTSATESGTAS
jgi:hypothetical protein